MTDDSGALSIDFLAGFTIFILAFIWVATMTPNLFLGLSSHTIDYDAVAYRTGVILAEDPGATGPVVTDSSPWEAQNPVTGKDNIARFGLAISRNTPNILDEKKIERFFCSTTSSSPPSAFIYPDEYQNRVIFGDYPYRFNISLKDTDTGEVRFVGDVIPEDHSYGYIRRHVKIKGSSNATITANAPMAYQACVNLTPPITYASYAACPKFNQYSLIIDSNELRFGKVRDPAYQIIAQNERIMINITNLTWSMNQSPLIPNPSTVNLTRVDFYERYWGFDHSLHPLLAAKYKNFTYEDGNTTPVNLPVNLEKDKTKLSNVSLIFERRAFSDIGEASTIFINLTFGIDPPQEYLNNTQSQPFNYTYVANANGEVTPPFLKDAVLEVAIW
jgi:hypothetical protein